MKVLMLAFFLLCSGHTSASAMPEMLYGYNIASLSASSMPRLDLFKGEWLFRDSGVGVSASMLALRYGNWEYTVRERSFDRWRNLTSESLSDTKSHYLVDWFPVGLYYLPYTWAGAGSKTGSLRLFYEYSSTWLKKDQHDLSANCDYANNSLGNRAVQDYGIVFDPGGSFRFKTGHVSIKRAASECTDSDSGKTYNFGSLTVSKWYAGIELLFGGITVKGGGSPNRSEIGADNSDENSLVTDLYERIVSSKIKRDRAVAKAKPARLKVEEVRFNDTGNKKGLIGGDSAVIALKLKNYGGFAGNVKAVVECKASNITIPSEFNLGNLDAGGSKKLEIPVTSDYGLKDGTVTVNIGFQEEQGNPPDPVVLEFQTFKIIPPKFEIAGINIDDGSYKETERLAFGNSNGIIEPGESAEVSVVLKNTGGEARAVQVELITDNNEPEIRTLANNNIPEIYDVGALENNEWRELKFAVSVSKLYRASHKYPFALKVSEQRAGFSKKTTLPIAVNEALPIAQKINITPRVNRKTGGTASPTFGDELLNVPETAMVNKDGVAVIIGVKNYSNKSVPSVDYALNDAELMRAYLIKALGYREGNIIYLENPTKADIEKVFGNSESYKGQLYDYVKRGKSDVFVYYTGHGAPDLDSKEGYFVPSDSDPNYVKFSGYPLSVFYGNLSKVPARDISVVIDACFSGTSDKGTIISKASPLLVVPVIPGAGKINIFTSSKAKEISSWYPDKRHSLFTYFFLKGLQGAADKNKDKVLTNGELYDYVSENVGYYARRLYGRNQNPTYIGREEVILRY